MLWTFAFEIKILQNLIGKLSNIFVTLVWYEGVVCTKCAGQLISCFDFFATTNEWLIKTKFEIKAFSFGSERHHNMAHPKDGQKMAKKWVHCNDYLYLLLNLFFRVKFATEWAFIELLNSSTKRIWSLKIIKKSF